MPGWSRRLIPGLLVLILLLGSWLWPRGAAIAASSEPPGSAYDVVLVEHLRLRVPADAVDAWIAAERGSWEPWLEAQPGFLDRQLLWDPEREEGTLLIHWRSRADWQTIPAAEVARVQQRFEQLAQQLTGNRQGNPFPLVFEGELLPQ